MSQPYKSGRQQNLNLGIKSVTENRTVLQTIGKVGIGTTNAQNHSLFVVGSTNITGDINVGGASTFIGVGTFGDSLYIANQLYVGGVSISGGASIGGDITTRNLLASGISTFNGIIDANSDLDVDGHTELDDLNVSGIATIQNLDVNGQFDVYDTQAVFHNNVRIDGNLSIGGTSTTIIAQDLKVLDKEITLGITTDAFGNDISTDDTANHGGIAIASTEGSPLVDLALVGYSTLPSTYKQLMWVAANSYGIGTTDAWMFNYAVGIGSTLVPNGVRFAVKEIQFTDNSINTPNINVAQNLTVSATSTLGIASASQLYVSGVSTFVGVGTFQNDLYVGGDLYVKDDLFFDEFTARNATITGFSTLGIASATTLYVSGVTTTASLDVTGTSLFQGGIQADSTIFANGGVTGNLTGNVNSTGSNTFGNVNVTGITTLGFTTTTQLYAKNLEVAGVSTFRGNAYFGDTDVLYFGDSNDLQVFHDGSNSYLRETGAGSLILASDGFGVDIYNVSQGEYQARFKNNGSVELYHDNIKRLETTGYGITVYNTIHAQQINISGIGTIDGVTIASGIVTSSNPGVTTIKYYGDGSNLFGVNAFNVVNQTLLSSPVYPTFANSTGVTSIGIAATEMGYVPLSGNLGIGSTNPIAKLQVVGDVVISGFTTLGTGATTPELFTNQLSVSGISTFIGITTSQSTIFGTQLSVSGFSTLTNLQVTGLTPNGTDFGNSQYLLRANGSGGWEWANVPGIFSVNNILNGFNVSDEGLIVGTAGSITQLDFIGSNITATADPQPNGIATIRVSDTPSFLTLNVSGISTFAGITTVTGDTLFTKQLSASGLSTFIGVGTFNNDLYVGGNLYIQNDLVFDEATVRNINVTGVSTLGIAGATTLNVTGVTTSTLLNVGVGGTIITTTNTTRVGINSISPNYTLDVNGDINFNGLLYQNNSPFIASRWSAGLGNDIYRLDGDVGIGTTNPQYTLEVVGNARISGVTSVTNLEIYSTVSAGSTTGVNNQYLKSTGIGVTWADFPTLRTTGITTATEGQSTFSFSYNVGFLDVFVNGVKLTASEYTANNGSSIVLISPAFANDIVEYIGYNTISTSGGGGSGGGASILNDLTDVTLTSPAAGETLTYDGTQWVNDYTVTASTSTTTQTVIHSLSSSNYRSAEYTIQATQGLKYHLTKILVVHDGLDAFPTEYGTVFTIDSLGTFDVDVSGGNIRLLVTPSAATTTDYKIKFTAFKV